jgi:hypothetical protein
MASGQASAGIYNPGESDEVVATYPDFINGPAGRNFRDVVLILRTIPGNPPKKGSDPLGLAGTFVDNPVRRRYAFLDELIARSPAGRFKTEEDLLQSSAVLIRRHKGKEAEQLLRSVLLARNPESENILLQSNFATALHRGGDPRSAYQTIRELLRDAWKENGWELLPEPRRKFLEDLGWDKEIYELYRVYESAYRDLLRLRLKEGTGKKGAQGPIQLPDALFDDGKDPPTPVKFLNESGQFEAGRIAPAERAKLPPRALAIVQQLVVWLPEDRRLYWLLGELYNAQEGPAGKMNEAGIRAAHQIFLDLSTDAKNFAKGGQLTADNVSTELALRLSALTRAVDALDEERQREVEEKLKRTIKPEESTSSLDWRWIAVSFGAGFLLALAVVWQVREIRRRRSVRANIPV